MALINPPVKMLPCVALPVELTMPPVNKLLPVILAPVIVPVALTVPGVARLPPVIVPVTLSALVILPVKLVVPETFKLELAVIVLAWKSA